MAADVSIVWKPLSPNFSRNKKKIKTFLFFSVLFDLWRRRLGTMMMMNRSLVLLLFYVLTVSSLASGKVILMRNNTTRSFDDIEANFGQFFLILRLQIVLCFCRIRGVWFTRICKLRSTQWEFLRAILLNWKKLICFLAQFLQPRQWSLQAKLGSLTSLSLSTLAKTWSTNRNRAQTKLPLSSWS